MPRSRWTAPRVARIAFLAGQGRDAKSIAADPLVGSTAHAVYLKLEAMGIRAGEEVAVPNGIVVDLPPRDLIEIRSQADRRQQSVGAFVGHLVGILATDAVLLANVVDDGL